MHGQPPHNPLSAAAREAQAIAREAKSPLFEKAALVIMALSAVVTTAIGALQVRHMLRREMREEAREEERERRAVASSPPERPTHHAAATAGEGEGRWTRREEHAGASGHGRQR